MSDLTDRIRIYITATDHVSFAELANRFGSDFRGGEHCLSDDLGRVLWMGMTPAAAEAVRRLLADGEVALRPCSPLVYFCDGSVPTMPIAKCARRYVKPHWLPVVLRPRGAA